MTIKRTGRQTGSVLSALFVCVLAAISSAAAEPLKIIGFGDSLMAGYQLAPGEGFTAQLQEALRADGYEVEVVNAGVSGDTTSAGLARLDWSVPEDSDGVILELGANDMLRGIAPAETKANLDAMLARLDERGIPVLLAGMMASPNLGEAYAEEFNGIYGSLAAKYDVPLYPFFLDGVATVGDLNLDDGMHPNAQGIAVMVERMLPSVKAWLDEIAAAEG